MYIQKYVNNWKLNIRCKDFRECSYHMFLFFYRIDRSRKNLEETGTYVDADIDSPVSSTKSDSDANTGATRINSVQKKDIPSQVLSNRRKSDMEISQASNSGEDSPLEGSSVVHTKLPPGKVNIFLSLYVHLLLYVQGIEEMKLIPLIILLWSIWLNFNIYRRLWTIIELNFLN